MKDRLIRFSLLSLLALLPAVVRASGVYNTEVYFWDVVPFAYDYIETRDGVYVANTPLAKGEAFRFFVVQDTRDNKAAPPCSFDPNGEIIPASGLTAERFKWCKCSYAISSNKIITSDWAKVIDQQGIPGIHTNQVTGGGYLNKISVFAESRFTDASSEQNIFLYLVAFDTRNDTGSCVEDPETAPGWASRYVVAKCLEVGKPPVVGAAFDLYVGFTVSSANTMELPILVSEDGKGSFKWMPIAFFKSMKVPQIDEKGNVVKDENGDVVMEVVDGTKPEGKARIEAYLTPVMQSFGPATPATENSLSTAETESASAFAPFALAASSPNLNYYALETKASLADQEWIDFTELVNAWVVEKGLDLEWKKDYTRCCIDGENPLKIPVWSGETGRFYRLRMVNQ